MILHMIRHGQTAGNLEKRYIGRTDEPLSEEGIRELSLRNYPVGELLICSPMLRCIQTAQQICQKNGMDLVAPLQITDFRECDFGAFEGKNYQELNGDPRYQRWIDSGGDLPFPEGESKDGFSKRTVQAFEKLIPVLMEYKEVVFVVHGGTIMALLEHYEAKHSYYDWQCKNGCGYTVEFDGKKMKQAGVIE